MFVTADGTHLPYGKWISFGNGISIMPMKTIHKIRHDTTRKVIKPPFKVGPGNDVLMMALYKQTYTEELAVYAYYCFGEDLLR